MNLQAAQRSDYSSSVTRNRIKKIRILILIIDAQAAARIDVVDLVSIGAQLANQGGDAIDSLCEGCSIGNLRADVNADARYFQITRGGGLGIEFASATNGDTE